MKDKSFIKSKNIVSEYQDLINEFSKKWDKDYIKLYHFMKNFDIDCSYDKEMIKPFYKDWSNMDGYADLLVKPINTIQCSIIFKICFYCNILLTISGGKTNLTGSATPLGGIVLSTIRLKKPEVKINGDKVISSVGIELELMRRQVLELSNNNLYYPVNPTSRNDASVGGTLSCNASGFIPGEKGATRYWVRDVEFLLPNGDIVQIHRNKYISNNGYFKLDYNGSLIDIPVPTYTRPKIKNASGLYSDKNGKIDLIDLVIGSEGILGMITSCALGLESNPKDYLELFISLESESKALDLHDFLYKFFNYDLGQINALEYFGYNCQNYMKHKEFFFTNNDVGVYIKIPIYNKSLDTKIEEWIGIIESFDAKFNLDHIIVLNNPMTSKKFFEARHSIPDNALTKTKKLGGVSIITDTIVPHHNYKIYLEKVHHKLRELKIEYLLFGHLGDCHLHFHLIPSIEQEKHCLDVYDYLIDLSADLGGVYSGEHGTGKRKRNDFKKCYGQDSVEMIKNLKLSLDPNNYLNKGNLVN